MKRLYVKKISPQRVGDLGCDVKSNRAEKGEKRQKSIVEGKKSVSLMALG